LFFGAGQEHGSTLGRNFRFRSARRQGSYGKRPSAFFNSFIPLHLQSVFIDVSYGVTKAAATLITPDTADCYAHALRTLGRFFEETANHELEILRMSRANGRVGAHGPRCFVSAKHGLLQAAAELHYCRRLADWREVNLDRMTATPAGGIDALINGQ
jgi:hypothetical protein